MTLLGIRYCQVAPSEQAKDLATLLGEGLGLKQADFGLGTAEAFAGAVFPAGESWVEIWPAGEGMPPGVMLQLVVDDADAYAERARRAGLDPKGPVDAHGERIYQLTGPGGMPISFQSRCPPHRD